MTAVLEQIAAQRVVPVIRTDTTEDAVATGRACARAGMRVVELTRTVPEVDHALEELRKDGLTLGVGTVSDARQVEPAAAAGASFFVSFTHPPGFVATAMSLGLTAIPGALTPTEFASCAEADAPAIKLFPARRFSPSYLDDLRAVLPGIRVIVTGGIKAHYGDITTWLEAGALAVGLGTDLGTVASVGAREVDRRARVALESAESRPTTKGGICDDGG